jgi:formamidopyrimidine-DNA glycosylase
MLLGFARRNKQCRNCRKWKSVGVVSRRNWWEPIVGVTIRAPKLRHEIPRELSELLPGCRIVAVRRRAKYLLIDCGRAGVEGTFDHPSRHVGQSAFRAAGFAAGKA